MKTVYCLFILLLYLGCNTGQHDKPVPVTDTSKVITTDTANIIGDSHYFWNADWDQKKGLVMKKTAPLFEDSLQPSPLIEKINGLYPEIQLRFVKISGDTIFTAIDKSSYLTKQVGSTGAKGYLAEVTYNLTELKDINFVHIQFTPGDHALPGTFSRTDFIK